MKYLSHAVVCALRLLFRWYVYVGGGPQLDVYEGVDASSLRLQQRPLRLR